MVTTSVNWGAQLKNRGWDGLNDAAINTFNSNVINSFVREMFQNSNDARDRELPVDPTTGQRPPLLVKINYKSLTQEQFPNYDAFIDIFRRIKSAPANKPHLEFFKHAEKAMGNRASIKFFIYEDFNTTGLSGNDDDPTSGFNSCVLSEGTSVKADDNAGGSYGIGKNAIFGFSKLRTVFYSSLNTKGEYIFQGVSKLASYQDGDGTHERRIFCGSGRDLSSIRSVDKLPKSLRDVFKRSDPGLSQFAACPVDNPDWLHQFVKAILRNYWLLLYNSNLVVELCEEDLLKLRIDKSNLEDLLLEYYDPVKYRREKVEPDGNPYEFYRCLLDNRYNERTIDKLGKVKFYFKELESGTTNRVAYMRNDMVVFSESEWGFGSINYCGLLICEDKEGNRILRMMEPPKHDSFDPERLSDKTSKYLPEDGHNIKWHFKQLINESLQEISDKYKKAAEDITWLDELMSSLTGAAGSGSGQRTNVESDSETTERIGAKLKASVNFQSLKRNTLVYDEFGTVQGPGSGPRPPSPPNPPHPPTPPRPGPHPGPSPTSQTRIGSRIFKTDKTSIINGTACFLYRAYLTSKQQLEPSDILISQKGDSGNVVCFEIHQVNDSNGRVIPFSRVTNKQGITTAFKLKSLTIPGELLLHISEPYKSSMKIVKSNE